MSNAYEKCLRPAQTIEFGKLSDSGDFPYSKGARRILIPAERGKVFHNGGHDTLLWASCPEVPLN